MALDNTHAPKQIWVVTPALMSSQSPFPVSSEGFAAMYAKRHGWKVEGPYALEEAADG